MSLSSYPRGQRKAAPPFSYTIFVLAFFEALLWLHPLLEAQNATKNNFTFSLCDFLQENVNNLKSVWSATSELYQAAQHPPEHEYSDQWELMDDEAEQRLHFSLQELAEARGHHVENVTVNSNLAYGRTKRMVVLTFHETQQKKDGTESIYGMTKTKENQTLFSPVVDYVRYVVYLAMLVLSIIAQGKGKRLLSLLSFLPLLSFNGAAALSLDEIGQVEPVPLSDHKGFYFLQLLTPSKALFLVLVVIMLVVYLLLCFWLSVGWLHFAKRLLFGTAPRHRKEDGNDIEQGYKGDEEEDYESEPEVEKEPEPKKVSSMTPGVMVDFKFKTNVLSDALVAYSSILNVSTLKSILFDHSNQEVDGDDRE